MSKVVRKVKKVAKKAAPIAAIALPLVAPGFGTAIGAALGASASAAPFIGNALIGAGLGAASGGGLKGALTGGVTSALGTGLSRALSGASVPGLGAIGRSSTVAGGVPVPGIKPSGALGNFGLSSLTKATPAGGSPLKLGSLLSAGGDVLGYMQSEDDIEDIQGMLARQSQQAQAQFQPYAQAGQQALANMQAPSLEALQNDPGYQFRLQQGNQALERSLAARGLGQSGAALKAAQEYGQGLADQTYNDYFTRQGQIAGQGFGAAQGLGSLYTNLGNVQAAAELERINQRNNLYSGLGRTFGGLFG